VLGEALINKALLYQFTGRPREARGLYATALDLAERDELAEVHGRALLNLANVEILWDQPDARRRADAALAVARRRSDRNDESVTGGNLMTVHLYEGRWDELERLARELLDPDPHRPGAEHLYHRLLLLHALRGEPDTVLASLASMTAWKDSDDAELRSIYDACVIATRLAEEKPADALELGLRMLAPTVETLTSAHDSVREALPDTLHAALRLGRHQDAHQIIAVLADQPPGHIPPYLRAQLARGRALLNAAEGHHDTVEHDLNTAIDTFETLGYRYWHAVAQTDLANWLTDQHRAAQARLLLEQATATLTTLKATPALTRAVTLQQQAHTPKPTDPAPATASH
jgi:tetratricopeptide (TPR) repeat protein